MRVLLTPRSGRRAGASEDGAVAVLVAVLLVVLIGIAAFTIDFGEAYNSKRQLQVSADAAALAAAGELSRDGVTCTTGWTMTQRDAAEAVAIDVMADNHPDASRLQLATDDPLITCTASGYADELLVTWRNQATTDVGLGQVFGVSTLTTNRIAKVVINEGQVGGLRPIGLCSAEASSLGMVRANFDGHNSDGGCDGAAGNWRQLDCPGTPNSGNPIYIDNIRNGCADPVVPVAGQPPSGSPALAPHLLAACPPDVQDSDEDCLSGNSGSVFGGQIPEAWESLINQSVRIPVMCGPGHCTPSAAFNEDASGTNSQFPVHQVAEVTICGVHKQNQNLASVMYGSPLLCPGAEVMILASDQAQARAQNWLLLNVTRVLNHNDPDVNASGPGSVNLVE